jgi:hypothetical protein
MKEDCNTLGKSTSLVALILGLFLIPNIPSAPVTKKQALSAILRPGLSATKIASEIIKRQSEAGAIVGVNDDGSANISEKMERIRVEEIIKAILLDARVTITLLPGQTTGPTGGGAPTTVITTGRGFGIMT